MSFLSRACRWLQERKNGFMGDLRGSQKPVHSKLIELFYRVQSSLLARAELESLFDQLLEKHFQVAWKKNLFQSREYLKEQVSDYFEYAQYYSKRKIPNLAARYFLIYCHGCWLIPSVTSEPFSLLISIFSLGVNLQKKKECLKVHQELLKVSSLMISPAERREILIPFYLQKWRVFLKKGQLHQELKELLEDLFALNPEHEVLKRDRLLLSRNKLLEDLHSDSPFFFQGQRRVKNSWPGLTHQVFFEEEQFSKSIFDSGIEKKVYQILVQRLPEYLILPNHPLANLFIYEEMRVMLNSSAFHYFHKSRVDYCIISKRHYKPIMGVELDGPDHDRMDIQEKDELKEEIFRLGGVPLIRLSCSRERDPEVIAKAVLERFCQKILA